MPKFSGSKAPKPNVIAPMRTVTKSGDPDTVTFEGGAGWSKDDKTALFSLAVSNMVSEKTYYEEGGARDKRFVDLTRKVAKSDPEWLARFIPYLRDTMNMRSASVVMAVEAVRALLGTKHGVNLRSMIDSAVVRADEPAEILGYYAAEHGRNYPMPIKRGVADAVRRVYNERSALKYDGLSRDFRMGDVIELTHPEPSDTRQSDVFKYLLDRRHNAEWPESGYPNLPIIQKTHEIDLIPVEQRRELLISGGIDPFKGSGFTWERVSGWINGPMDAPVWEAIIPQMGYMALLRNLRNFEQAGISKEKVDFVRAKLTNPEEVARSRQFPFRFLSAYLNVNSVLWDEAVETALDLSTQNVPEFPGKTLVLVDVSGSMQMAISEKSKVQRYQIAAVLGASIAAKNNVDLVPYATRWTTIDVPRGSSILKVTKKLDEVAKNGRLEHGTETWAAMKASYKNHDRVINISDMQAFGGYGSHPDSFVTCPIYNFDVGGYGQTNMAVGEKGRYEFAGFNDQAFKAMKIIEEKKGADWPF